MLVDSILTVTETDAFTYTTNSIYSGGSLSFSSTSANDQLSLPTVGSATTTSGVVSATSDGKIWLGTGSAATQFGTFTGSGTNDIVISFSSGLVTDQVVQSFARQVTFANDASTTPSTPSTITISVTDGTARTVTATTQVNFIAGNGANEIPTLTLSAATTNVITGGNAHTVDAGLTVTGAGNIPEAQVVVENYQTGDQLTWSAAAASTDGLTTVFNITTGVLTVTSSTATAAQYQDFLRTVTFSTTSTSAVARTVDIVLGAGLYYSYNGHFYEYISDSGITFQQAEVMRRKRRSMAFRAILQPRPPPERTPSSRLAFRAKAGRAPATGRRRRCLTVRRPPTAIGIGWMALKACRSPPTASPDNISSSRSVAGRPIRTADPPIIGPTATIPHAMAAAMSSTAPMPIGPPASRTNFDQSGVPGEQYAHFYGPNDAGAPGTWNDYAAKLFPDTGLCR